MFLSYTVQENQSFQDFLKSTQLPNKLIRTILSQRLIKINHQDDVYTDRLNKEDIITFTLPDEAIDQRIVHEDIPLDIVYEDDYLLVINKQAKMPVMVTKAHLTNTLSNALCFYYQKNNIPSKIHLVNRLDKDTSGLMIVAKNRYIKYLLSEDLKQKITRKYQCVIVGQLPNKSGTIDQPIGKIDPLEIKRSVMHSGLRAITHYHVLKESDLYSLLEVVLETGRTHQIRVHLAYLGHPIVGDILYNSTAPNASDLLLCSHHLSFIHPITHEPMNFTIALPAVFDHYFKS